MLWWASVGFAVISGICVVFQNGLNEKLLRGFVAPWVLFVNAAVFGVASAVWWSGVGFVRAREGSTASFEIWHIVPGLLGFALVALLPRAFAGLGALGALGVFLTTQLLLGMCWDYWIAREAPTLSKITGLIFVLAGAWLILRRPV
jgi:uncharacterized membrane protein YdcZ (DUF606 family)